jgi:hypothetical protein
MDRALSKYRGEENPRAWIDDALAIAERCREVEGVWCGIWHPNLSTPLGFPDATQAFASLVEELTSRAPWASTAEDIVRWRRVRRGVRAVGGDAAGVVRLRHIGDRVPALEDHTGQPVRAVSA